MQDNVNEKSGLFEVKQSKCYAEKNSTENMRKRFRKEGSMVATTTSETAVFKVYPASERGLSQLDWLTSYHSLSFNDFQCPERTPFSCLRVMNDDVIAPSGGFATHGHRDMEIVTVVLSGELQHRDSLGNGSIIQAGDVQRMTAGTGIQHSEFNPSETVPVHLYQLWFFPQEKNLTPGYEQIPFHVSERQGRWCLIVDSAERAVPGVVKVNQDVRLWMREALPEELGQSITFDAQDGRALWLQVLSGSLSFEGLDGQTLSAGDAVFSDSARQFNVTFASPETQVLVFDLPSVSENV
jgi:quercetin 2,3-dioxygenase